MKECFTTIYEPRKFSLVKRKLKKYVSMLEFKLCLKLNESLVHTDAYRHELRSTLENFDGFYLQTNEQHRALRCKLIVDSSLLEITFRKSAM